MTKYDLFESIGNVNDEAIENAKKPVFSVRKTMISIGAIAACAVFACAGILIYQNLNSGGNTALNYGLVSTLEASEQLNKDEVMKILDKTKMNLYFVKDGKLEYKEIETDVTPRKIFELWKKENDIGDEVRFISTEITDNSKTEISEVDGVEIAVHTPGDYFIYNLTITKNIEQYYDTIGKDLLLESLKKTMTECYGDMKINEYHLFLSDMNPDDIPESDDSAADDIRYDEHGAILE